MGAVTLQRAAARVSLAFAALAAATACVGAGNGDAGPEPGLSEAEVDEACGEPASVAELEGEEIISGTCRIESKRQVDLFNSFEIARLLGTLQIVLAQDETDDVTIEHLTRAREVRVGPGADVVSVRLPVLATLEDLSVRLNERLATFVAPSLVEVSGFFEFSENAVFATCDAEALLTQLTAPPDQVLVEANCEACCR